MLRIAAIFLFLSMILRTADRFIIELDYRINIAAWEKNCENKAKPELQCRGKCQLSKQVKQSAEKDEEQPTRKTFEELSRRSFFAGVTKTEFHFPSDNHSMHLCKLAAGIAADIFHPPAA